MTYDHPSADHVALLSTLGSLPTKSSSGHSGHRSILAIQVRRRLRAAYLSMDFGILRGDVDMQYRLC